MQEADIIVKLKRYVLLMVFTYRLGGRMDRQSDRQRQRIGTYRQPDRRINRRPAGRLDRFVVRLGPERNGWHAAGIRHRRSGAAMDRLPLHTASRDCEISKEHHPRLRSEALFPTSGYPSALRGAATFRTTGRVCGTDECRTGRSRAIT